MKFSDRLSSAVRGPAAPAPPGGEARRITPQLEAAETELAALEHEHGEVAFAAFLKEPGAADNLAACRARVSAQRDVVDGLRAAHVVAQQRDAAAERAGRAALAKTQINAISQHLGARDRAAMDLTAALTNAVTALRTLVDRSDKARAANPIGGEWPNETLCDFGTLHRLVAHEIYRLVGDARMDGQCIFPGGRAPDVMTVQNPSAIPPLLDAIKQASEHTLAVLRGRVVG